MNCIYRRLGFYVLSIITFIPTNLINGQNQNSYNTSITSDVRFTGSDTTKSIQTLQQEFNESYSFWKNAYKYVGKSMDSIKVDMNESIYDEINKTAKNQAGDTVNLSRKTIKQVRDSVFFNKWDETFYRLNLLDNRCQECSVAIELSKIDDHEYLQYILIIYSARNYSDVAPVIKQRNIHFIKERLAVLEERNFVHYRSNHAKREKIKEIDFNMDNDAFIFLPTDFNQDREYTGGGSITVSTDYFSSRWFNFGDLRYLRNKDFDQPYNMMMSYQSISVGMNFYTPYIRYRNYYELADTLFQYDRPFASYVHIDRNKYRIWPKGLVRNSTSLQVGVIGSDLGRDIQALLHRDAIVSSQKVYGWDTQIANGGRWLVQTSADVDLLLFSTTNDYATVFKPNNENASVRNKNFGLNLIGSAEAFLGGYLTAYGFGLHISTSDFKSTSGENMIKANRVWIFPEFGFSMEAGIKYRRIIHNSLLEGFGYFRTFIDDDLDDESESEYTLNSEWYELQNELRDRIIGKDESWVYPKTPEEHDQLNRDMIFGDAKFQLRFRKMALYYQVTFSSKPYKDIPVNYDGLANLVPAEDIDFYNEKIVSELERYNDRDYYGYGRIGLIWLID